MKSRSKTILSNDVISELLDTNGFTDVHQICPLGQGEFNAVYSLDTSEGQYALKVAPIKSIPVLTYEKGMMEAEVYWYDQIKKHTTIEVPKIIIAKTDQEELPAPWFLMDLLHGVGLDQFDFLPEELPQKHNRLVEMVAQIHRITNHEYGYVQNHLYDNWYSAIRSMVVNLLEDAKNVSKTSKRGNQLLQYIDQNEVVLREVPCTMVNFDLWPSNIICQRINSEIHFTWIDPERSFWGDPIADFVSFEFLVPLEKKTRTITLYNQVSAWKVTVSKEEQIRYAIMEAYLALIMEVEKYYRYTPSNPGWARNVVVSKLLYHQAFSILKGL